MKDANFLKANNARSLWHPMAHPAEMQAHPPTIITGSSGVSITDVDGRTVIDAVGGLWNVNLGPSWDRSPDSSACISARLSSSEATIFPVIASTSTS